MKLIFFTLLFSQAHGQSLPAMDVGNWKNGGRTKTLEVFANEVYGKVPSGKVASEWVLDRESLIFEKKVHRREYVLTLGGALKVRALAYIPVTNKKVPAFLGLNFKGNHSVEADEQPPFPRPPVRPDGWLRGLPQKQIPSSNHQRRLASYNPDWASAPRRSHKRSKPLQVDLVIEAATRRLKEAPTGELPLIDLVRKLESEMEIVRPSIYAAIDQSEEIEKIGVDGSVFKICRLTGQSSTNFPQITNLGNVDWRAECERAVAKLGLDEVDIGLFMLGRQFDEAMSKLLEEARDREGMEVTDGHLKSLNNRIEWACRHEVFTDKATLNLLRVERNERGHKAPTIAEREAIMKFAPFLAGLYIDYLILIDARIGSFSGGSLTTHPRHQPPSS